MFDRLVRIALGPFAPYIVVVFIVGSFGCWLAHLDGAANLLAGTAVAICSLNYGYELGKRR